MRLVKSPMFSSQKKVEEVLDLLLSSVSVFSSIVKIMKPTCNLNMISVPSFVYGHDFSSFHFVLKFASLEKSCYLLVLHFLQLLFKISYF